MGGDADATPPHINTQEPNFLNRKPKTENRKLETGNRKPPTNLFPFPGWCVRCLLSGLRAGLRFPR
ncbi:MAG: hypothetical protein FJ135_05000 [Deltaproteobacteria bacterium]|nr:hypothetical protein [Deltaproteobacteria bacterium]